MRHLLILAALSVSPAPAQNLSLQTASGHPMQYYLSLPDGWSLQRKWPAVIVIESANREFQHTGALFAQARGNRPFLLAVPLVVTNGGAAYRQVPTYRYSSSDWDRVEREGGCKFDAEGVEAVAADLRSRYSAEDKYFLTGWEAGGHTVWAAIFGRPERLRAAALAGPNYQGRCVEFSSSAARGSLPVKVFLSGIDTSLAPNKYVHLQSEQAKRSGEEHGFQAISIQELAGRPHGPMAEEVLAYFASLR